MASLLEMSCACGYRRLVRTGGLMQTWEEESWWPFYCSSCGVVDVNFRNPLVCSRCGTTEIVAYGEAPVSHRQDCRFAYVQAWDYEACKHGHLCPSCHRYELIFDRSKVFVIGD